MNQITLIGNIGKEIKLTEGEIPRVNFSMATNDRYNGEKKVEWHYVTAFGKIAEVIKTYCAAGSRIMIQGTLQYFEHEKDGFKYKTASVLCKNMELLGGVKNVEVQTQEQQKTEPSQKAQDFAAAVFGIETEKLPY